MKYTLTILSVDRNEEATTVAISIIGEAKSRTEHAEVFETSLGLAPDATAADIRKEAKKYLSTFSDDRNRADDEKVAKKTAEEKALKLQKETDTLKEELEGEEIILGKK